MKKLLSVVLFAVMLVAAPSALSQDAPPPAPVQPNEGTHISFTGSYTVDGSQIAVAGINVPVTNRWSINLVNAFAPDVMLADGSSGVSFHVVEVEYARNLSDLFKAQSSQFNSDRFNFAVSGGLGSARNAQGSGNASFAFSAAGRFTLKLNESTSLDIVNVRYFRSRIAALVGQQGGDFQAGTGFGISF